MKFCYIHVLNIEIAEFQARIRWVRGAKTVRASVTLARKKNTSVLKEVIVVVPAKWKFMGRIEELIEDTEPEVLGELVCNWHFWEQLVYSGLIFGEEEPFVSLTSNTFYPDVRSWKNMAEESLRLVATALERLTLSQQNQGWARHLKSPDVFKPDSRDAELKGWSVWKFSFLNCVKGLDPSMAQSMDMVEENIDADYSLGDMTDETKAKAIRLYSLLTSFLRLRPLKLIRHVKNVSGFQAWQVLIKEMQHATRAISGFAKSIVEDSVR